MVCWVICFFHLVPQAVTSGRPRVVETTWMRSVTFASVETASHILTVSVRTAAKFSGAAIVVADQSPFFLMIGKGKYPKNIKKYV